MHGEGGEVLEIPLKDSVITSEDMLADKVLEDCTFELCSNPAYISTTS